MFSPEQLPIKKTLATEFGVFTKVTTFQLYSNSLTNYENAPSPYVRAHLRPSALRMRGSQQPPAHQPSALSPHSRPANK